jgi:predicted TIM-barrel fold metal-dependent hydrolase
MILDGHIHINANSAINKPDLDDKMSKAGVDGGVILSISPNSFHPNGQHFSLQERLDNLFQWAGGSNNLFPFFWIDPTEPDAGDQVNEACDRGVAGFKIICGHHYPGDERAVKVYKAIAKKGKPILFHSGILWDGKPSACYNRPGEFEVLLEVDGLKFALAHISWPWCDENIAVYGKFLNAYSQRPDLSVEMFIDITPGTPVIYREEALTKLFTVGYDITNNIIFGTDCNTGNYNTQWSSEWISRDNGIYGKLGLSGDVLSRIYCENLKRFLGISKVKVKHNALESGK